MRVEELFLDLLDTSGLVFFFPSLCLFWWDGNGTETTSCMEQMSGSSIVSRSNQKLGTTTFEMDSAMS